MSKSLSRFQALNEWYSKVGRMLPWRQNRDPYRIWISEIMLQQTQIKTVIPYYERWMRRFPDVLTLSRAKPQEVLKLWAGLGYYSRARNLHMTARVLARENRFPETSEAWHALPGIGPYTAAAIVSIAWDHPEAVLDGNVERVLSRWECIGRTRSEPAYRATLTSLSQNQLNQALELGVPPSVWNQAVMELGEMICTPRDPSCTGCPVRTDCRSARENQVQVFPHPRLRPRRIQVREKVFCIWEHGGKRVLLEKQGKGSWREGLWDFPEEPPFPLKRCQPLGTVKTDHVVTRHEIARTTKVFRLSGAGSLRSGERKKYRWVSARTLGVPVGAAFSKCFREIRKLCS